MRVHVLVHTPPRVSFSLAHEPWSLLAACHDLIMLQGRRNSEKSILIYLLHQVTIYATLHIFLCVPGAPRAHSLVNVVLAGLRERGKAGRGKWGGAQTLRSVVYDERGRGRGREGVKGKEGEREREKKKEREREREGD